MQLLPSQKNAIFDAIVEGGLSPLQFEYSEHNSGKETFLSFKNSNYYFHFENVLGKRFASFSPGIEKLKERIDCPNWDVQLYYVKQWIGFLQREISQPDKWGELLKAGSTLKWTINDSQNTPFTFAEVQDIRNTLNEVKSKIGELSLSGDQMRLIEDRLGYIAIKAENLGRIDWKNLLIGTLIGTVVQLSVTPEMAKTIWSIFSMVFKRIIMIAIQ